MAEIHPSNRRARRRAVERRTLRAADGCALAVAHVHTDAPVERGILLVPPLIGASYVLFGRQFGLLLKAGYRIVSLNYRGHPPSEGRFTLRASFDDTLTLARQVKAENPETPLSAVGTCSGSMPIFHILDQEPELLERLIFVNAIYDIQQTATPLQGIRMYLSARGLRWPGSLGEAVSVVLDEVFPEIEKDETHFGILPYDRVLRGTIIREYLLRGGPNTDFVSWKDALCCYGLRDRMLGLADPASEKAYRAAFRRRFPRITFSSFESDHFMTGLRQQIAERVRTFLDGERSGSADGDGGGYLRDQ